MLISPMSHAAFKCTKTQSYSNTTPITNKYIHKKYLCRMGGFYKIQFVSYDYVEVCAVLPCVMHVKDRNENTQIHTTAIQTVPYISLIVIRHALI